MDSEKLGVIGAGIMGNGIAQVAAQSGFQVILIDVDNQALENGIRTILKSLSRFEEKGKISQKDIDEIKSKIKPTINFDALADVHVVIEAIPEDMVMKKKVFQQIESICNKEAILATNTSSLSITEIASVTNRPEKVVGMHFANPVPIMPGVEIIKGLETSQETLDAVYDLAIRFGKTCYLAKDFPGFAGNRLLMPMINEAFYILWQGISTAEDIDRVGTLSLRHPMGPLELADLIGLDTVLSILEYLHKEIGERYRPSPLLKQLVLGKQLGVKTGNGVYDYKDGKKKSRLF